jgi:Putative peptidoglycan-binding domain-containing protein
MPPDPRRSASAAEFVTEMRRLRAWSGLTFRQLERNAAEAGDVLPHSTLVDALRRDRLPREDLLRAFVRACGLGPKEVACWVAERRRLAADLATVPPRAAVRHGTGQRAAAPDAGAGSDDVAVASRGPSGGQSRGPSHGHGRSRSVRTATPRAKAAASRPRPPRRRSRRRSPRSVPAALAALGALAALLVVPSSAVHVPSVAGAAALSRYQSGNRYEDCPVPLALGAYGMCVVRVQEHLRRHGLVLPVDAWFGPYTKMRVAAFQTLAGLPNTGMVDAETWRALEARTPVAMPYRSAADVRRRIAEVFGDAADEAIELADCLSNTDHLWIYSTEPGTRRWGLFQFDDLELHRAGATQAMALDPDWNIRAAHAVWSRTRDFRHWTCTPAAIPRAR